MVIYEDKDNASQAIDRYEGILKYLYGDVPLDRVHQWLYSMLRKTGGHNHISNYTLKQIEDRHNSLKDPIRFPEGEDLHTYKMSSKKIYAYSPATGLPMQRVVPAVEITIAGRFIPEDT